MNEVSLMQDNKISINNNLDTNLDILSLSLKDYFILKKKAISFAKSNSELKFSEKAVTSPTHIAWYFDKKYLFDVEYNVLLVMNSPKMLSLSKKDRLIGEVEPGVFVFKRDGLSINDFVNSVVFDSELFSKFEKLYDARLNKAHNSLKGCIDFNDKCGLEVDVDDILKGILPFISMTLPYTIYERPLSFINELVSNSNYFNDENIKSSNDLLLDLTSNYFDKTLRATLLMLEKNFKSGFNGYTSKNIYRLIKEVGFLSRSSFEPCSLETYFGMEKFVSSVMSGKSLEDIQDKLDEIFFRQRINHQAYWRAKSKLLDSIPETQISAVNNYVDYVTLSIKYNEESRVVRNKFYSKLYAFVSKYENSYTLRRFNDFKTIFGT